MSSVSIPLLPHQLWFANKVVRPTHRFPVVSGGVSAGKTHTITSSAAMIAGWQGSHGARKGIITEPTNDLVRDLLIPEFEQNLPKWGIPFSSKLSPLPQIKMHFKGFDYTWLLRSGENYKRIIGHNIDAALADEIDCMGFEAAKALIKNLNNRVRRGRGGVVGMVGTSDGTFLDWFFYDPVNIGKNNRIAIEVNAYDNPFVSHEHLKTIEEDYSENDVQALVYGKIGQRKKEGCVYYCYDKARNFIDLPDDGAPLHVGMDFNVDPMAAIVFWQKGRHIHVIDEFLLPNADTQLMCQKIEERYPRRIHKCYPDPSGKQRHTNSPGGLTDFHFIRNAGWQVCAPSKAWNIRDRENRVNGKLKPAKGGPVLTVSRKCANLDLALRNYTHQNRNKDEGKRFSHIIDALGYPVIFLSPPVRPSVTNRKQRTL